MSKGVVDMEKKMTDEPFMEDPFRKGECEFCGSKGTVFASGGDQLCGYCFMNRLFAGPCIPRGFLEDIRLWLKEAELCLERAEKIRREAEERRREKP